MSQKPKLPLLTQSKFTRKLLRVSTTYVSVYLTKTTSQITHHQVPTPIGCILLKSNFDSTFLLHIDQEVRIIQSKESKSSVFSNSLQLTNHTLQPTKQTGCGDRIWTYDLRVMSPTSCQTAPPRDWKNEIIRTQILSCQHYYAFKCKWINFKSPHRN